MRRTHQRGIAIGPILFVVALLAVLASIIAAGSGSFNSDISAVKAKAQATAILEYAHEVKFAVDRVSGKGCKDTEISFENPIVSGYENPNAPSDKSCHVFDVNGGGVVWKEPPNDVAFTGDLTNGKYAFVLNGVKNIGSSVDKDLVILLSIKMSTASVIASMLGQTGIPESSGIHDGGSTIFRKFSGNFGTWDGAVISGDIPNIKLGAEGVFCDIAGFCTSTALYYYFLVLITR